MECWEGDFSAGCDCITEVLLRQAAVVPRVPPSSFLAPTSVTWLLPGLVSRVELV